MRNLLEQYNRCGIVPVTVPTWSYGSVDSGYYANNYGDTATPPAPSTWGIDTGTRTFAHIGHRPRIRQSGTIRACRVYCGSTGIGTLTNRVWRVFRYNGSTYDTVGSSETITAALNASAWNTDTLATPITGVKVGDFLGIKITTSGGFQAIAGENHGASQQWQVAYSTGDITGSTITWGTTNNAYSMAIQCQMDAPVWISAGDSYAGGGDDTASTCGSYNDDTALVNFTTQTPTSNVLGYAAELAPNLFSYANHGLGGTTANAWNTSHLATWVTPYHPRAVLFSGGANDLVSGGRTIQQFRSDLISIVQKLRTAEIIPVLWTIPQADVSRPKLRSWNRVIRKVAAEQQVAVLDAWNILGAAANADGRNTTQYSTAEHPNKSAYKTLAQALISMVRPV